MKRYEKTISLLCVIFLSGSVRAQWKFGIIADTQWKKDDGMNPNSVAVGIIRQVDREFIRHGVRFVIALGDLSNDGLPVGVDTRATYTQDLYNAGIAFYPIRGNHDDHAATAAEFVRVFPQTQNGVNNRTPEDAFNYTDSAMTHPVPKLGERFTLGTCFSSPSPSLAGLSYAFTYENATFVMIDAFTLADSSANTVASQQDWISHVISSRAPGTHAFVIGHQGVIMEDHDDTFFGENPAENPEDSDRFIRSLYKNGVRLLFGGHDHMHNRAIVTTTDGGPAHVQQLIVASDSYKFYTPVVPSNDEKFNLPAFGRLRQFQLAQDLYQIGYSIVTVDGPDVTVDYYGVPSGQENGRISVTPVLTGRWQKRESYGYTLEGRSFLVAPGDSYASVRDAFSGDSVCVLGGTNDSTFKDFAGRPFYRLVEAAWKKRNEQQAFQGMASHMVRLRGMTRVGRGDTTDVYVLGLTYTMPARMEKTLKRGLPALVSKNRDGEWVPAAELNFGGKGQFMSGPYRERYPLGTWGVDRKRKTVWAVVNREGVFAAAILEKSGNRCRVRE